MTMQYNRTLVLFLEKSQLKSPFRTTTYKLLSVTVGFRKATSDWCYVMKWWHEICHGTFGIKNAQLEKNEPQIAPMEQSNSLLNRSLESLVQRRRSSKHLRRTRSQYVSRLAVSNKLSKCWLILKWLRTKLRKYVIIITNTRRRYLTAEAWSPPSHVCRLRE